MQNLIITGTLSGYTARKLSNMKPNCSIFATCDNEKVARTLSLFYGVEASVIKFYASTDEMINNSIKLAKEKFNLQKDDVIVVTGGFIGNTYASHTTNLMKIVTI